MESEGTSFLTDRCAGHKSAPDFYKRKWSEPWGIVETVSIKRTALRVRDFDKIVAFTIKSLTSVKFES